MSFHLHLGDAAPAHESKMAIPKINHSRAERPVGEGWIKRGSY